MKLVIEIKDVRDPEACRAAAERLGEAVIEHHGEQNAIIWLGSAMFGDHASPRFLAKRRFIDACGSFPPEDLRLVLEYYKMTKPSKEGLARELAKRNETLPRAERYGPRGTTTR
jgi:hypothetical protein